MRQTKKYLLLQIQKTALFFGIKSEKSAISVHRHHKMSGLQKVLTEPNFH